MLEINTKAPDFLLHDQFGKEHALSDYLGKKVILYFYPKDNTPGCSMQACNYNDSINIFRNLNIEVIGISKDSVASHMKFMEKYHLSFTLLSDENLDVIKAYDVWHEKNLYGKISMGVVRTTYLIDENGIIRYASDKVKAKQDALDMLEIVK